MRTTESSPTEGQISNVRAGSLAEEAGIRGGDTLVSLNGRSLRDVVDLKFYQAEEEVEVVVRKPTGLEEIFVFEKEIDEDLGFEFDRATWDDVTLCNNNCFFCFLKGLPRGMRRTLYMKDDDYRLSFLHGNFVTLTNLTEADWARLDEQRLSPLNVSVHATDPDLRALMLGNLKATPVMERLRRLQSLRIEANTQIVLCPGVNDGANLARSIEDLASLYPTVRTISVVPVGASPKLESWSLDRDGIALERPTQAYARALIRQIRPHQRRLRALHGETILQVSDEYYLAAGIPVPPAYMYDGYPQYENGLGMVRAMKQDWNATRRRLAAAPGNTAPGRHVVIGCGSLIGPTLAAVGYELASLTGATIDVVPVTNTVFGERVNVSGLLCGHDFVEQIGGRTPDCYILPRASLDYFGTKFLDDMTVDDVERGLGAPVTFASQWSEVLQILVHGPQRPGRNEVSNGAFWSEPAQSPAMVSA